MVDTVVKIFFKEQAAVLMIFLNQLCVSPLAFRRQARPVTVQQGTEPHRIRAGTQISLAGLVIPCLPCVTRLALDRVFGIERTM